MTLDTKRHDDLFDKRQCTLPVHVVGVGGVGSHVARLLAKLGVGEYGPVHVWDGDKIEPHNVSNQAYDPADIEAQKAEATQRHFKRRSGVEIMAHAEFVTKRIPFSGIVFLCLDDMDVRRDICEKSIWRNMDVPLLIETRMDAAHAQTHTLDPRDERHIGIWNLRWYPQSEVDNLMGCGGPLSVITAVEMTAVIAVQQFIHWSNQRSLENIVNEIEIDLVTWEIKTRIW